MMPWLPAAIKEQAVKIEVAPEWRLYFVLFNLFCILAVWIYTKFGFTRAPTVDAKLVSKLSTYKAFLDKEVIVKKKVLYDKYFKSVASDLK